MRNAALQVEMDEFMTLRRLNLEIQGLPESYTTTPLEPHPLAVSGGVAYTGEEMMRSSPPLGLVDHDVP